MGKHLVADLFAEDRAHEEFIKPLVKRCARDLGTDVELRVISAYGGHGRAIHEFMGYQYRLRKHAVSSPPNLVIVAIDANCMTFSEARRQIDEAMDNTVRECAVVACPDPHIERWYLADLEAFYKVVGVRPSVPQGKCERKFYKDILAKAVRDAGYPTMLKGIEFAAEIAEKMDFYRAGKSENSLKHFVDDLSGLLKRG